MRLISWFARVVFPPKFSYSVLRGYLGTVELFHSRRRAYHSRPRKMADARPTFPLPQRYTQRKQKQFSRPMTGHTPQKLPPFGAISCIIAVQCVDFAHTRSIILTRTAPFVNCFFRIYHKFFVYFLSISQINFLPKQSSDAF